MMIAMLLADVAAVVYPLPPTIIKARPTSYPLSLLRGKKGPPVGYARVLITVNPAGKVIHCDVSVSSGVPELDTEACGGFRDAKARPAYYDENRPAFGTRGVSVSFTTSGQSLLKPPSVDLELVVNRLPDGEGPFATRAAALTVDAAGKVTACRTDEPVDALKLALCKVATTQIAFKPVLDASNSPVPSIQLFTVEFSQKDAPLERQLKAPRIKPDELDKDPEALKRRLREQERAR